jgi:hypothetical protein
LLLFLPSGRAAKARNWNGESGYRLHVSPLNPRTSRREIENIFSKFGTINEVRSSSFSIIYFLIGKFRFGWQLIHPVLRL